MKLFTITTSAWAEEDFMLATSLDEKQVRSVIQPLVDDEIENDIIYTNSDYIEALRTRYPKAIILPDYETENINFSPTNL